MIKNMFMAATFVGWIEGILFTESRQIRTYSLIINVLFLSRSSFKKDFNSFVLGKVCGRVHATNLFCR